jgi:hypothetical protein
LPIHFGDCAPQCWQKYAVLVFAIADASYKKSRQRLAGSKQVKNEKINVGLSFQRREWERGN